MESNKYDKFIADAAREYLRVLERPNQNTEIITEKFQKLQRVVESEKQGKNPNEV